MVTLLPLAKPNATEVKKDNEPLQSEEEEKVDHNSLDEIEEEEDPYNLCPEDIYDTVDANSTYNPVVLNRPPAPIPRPELNTELEKSTTYISRGMVQSDFYFLRYIFFISQMCQKYVTFIFLIVFSDKGTSENKAKDMGYHAGKSQ